MKRSTLLIILFSLFSSPVFAEQSDREQVNQAIQCFFDWDKTGNPDTGKKCVYEGILFQYVNKEGSIGKFTPKLLNDGDQGVVHRLLDLDIYNDLAVVTALTQHAPISDDNTYMKNITLHKTIDGWRVTNVFWGRAQFNQ